MLTMCLLSNEEGRALLEIARRAIRTAVVEKCLPDFPPCSIKLAVPAGLFVSLYSNGRLRGCVGHLGNTESTVDAVTRAAINAALHDPRFAPVSAGELEALEIELSILSQPEPIAPEAVVPGTHGVLVTHEDRRGLLLPQVATERQWSGQRLVEETCTKAGLLPDQWRDPRTQIFGFTAQIFREADLKLLSNF
jgi:AmmeMemoRadiSam system protein A